MTERPPITRLAGWLRPSGGIAPDAARQTAAAITVAWLVIANKPFYPLYIWWITGTGLTVAGLAALMAPFYLALILLARRDTLWVRVGLPLIGMLDTIIATKIFGGASGVELFAVPCALLVALSFVAGEERIARLITGLLFVAVITLHLNNEAWTTVWTPAQAAALLPMNVISAASMSAFILLRFSRRETGPTGDA